MKNSRLQLCESSSNKQILNFKTNDIELQSLPSTSSAILNTCITLRRGLINDTSSNENQTYYHNNNLQKQSKLAK